jgi:K+-sensing histidine kinase KdpD
MLATLLCSSVALVVSLVARNKSWSGVIPLWFLAVLFIVVMRWGALAGVLATTFSGLVFAAYLFEPFGTVIVSDTNQKNSLMWMLLIGVAMSLFGHSPTDSNRRKPPTSAV